MNVITVFIVPKHLTHWPIKGLINIMRLHCLYCLDRRLSFHFSSRLLSTRQMENTKAFRTFILN
jgi:hypothetical protein